MSPHTPVDVAGNGAARSLSSLLGGVTKCKWFQVTGVLIAARANVGDAGVTATRGIPVFPGGSQFAPPIALAMEFYDLTSWYLWLDNGDTASVACAV